MFKVKSGKALTASLLILSMLCAVTPESSFAAAPAEERVRAEELKKEEGAAPKDVKTAGAEADRKKAGGREAIDSIGEVDWDDIDFANAVDMTEDTVQAVNIETEGSYKVFRFVPEVTGEYTFFSVGNFDTVGMIGNEHTYRYNDDGDEDSNFSITEDLTAGETYYCVAQMYSASRTGSFLCMISSTRTSYELETDNIERFEILQPAKDIWYEYESDQIWGYDVPMIGLKYRIACKDGAVIESALESVYGASADLYGLTLSGRFKYYTEDNLYVDTDREDNAIIYSIGNYENAQAFSVEVPVAFGVASPVASITLDRNPWANQTIGQSNAYDALNDREGLAFTVTYTDGTTKTVDVDEGDSSVSIADGYNERVAYSWKNYSDDDGEIPAAGPNAIVISYIGVSAEVPVTVVNDRVSSIQIVRNPSKMSYSAFERRPDLYGMQLKINLANGTATTVTIESHGSGLSIWNGNRYEDLNSWFVTENNRKYVAVNYCDAYAYYYPTVQTVASALATASSILPGRAASIALNAGVTYRIFRFAPLETKEYTISSAGNFDTYVELMDSAGNILNDDDDGADDNAGNFKLASTLQAGKTYYYMVKMFSSGETGTFTVTLGGASAYTITYNLNGGVNHASNPAAYYSEAVNLQNPSRANYAFAGWYTDSACKNKITQISGSAKTNYVLYAKWQKVKKPGKANLTSASNGKAKKITVKYKKVKKAEGYEIAYALNKKFKKASFVTAKKTKATIGKLKKGKTYYVRVCAYNLDSTGQKVRGKWSSVKKVTVKK